ncbi:MAG TPA: metal ABC transporter substrate-binding protein [Planctomycetota bacterium]|nr:metal ABC transporter substrate-binding protein [Planctomycetota bacterium]
MPRYILRATILTALSAAAILPLAISSVLAEDAPRPLKVCTTVPDLARIASEVGGDEVEVVSFARGTQDPHFLEARPSYIKELSTADLFVQVGLDLEVGWAPNLLQNARNGRVLPGAPGFLDASAAIVPREAPPGVVDRSMGDVHAHGNPHYLIDPVNGLRVARAVADRLTRLRPARKDYFAARLEDFSKRIQAALVGKDLAAKYDAEKLALLAESGKLREFLEKRGHGRLLGGWLGRTAAIDGAEVVGDHNIWPYFAARFGLRVVGFLEPRPGISPTTKHLGALVAEMRSRKVRGILTVPYFDPRHARFVSEATGAKVIRLAHQCGALPGTDDYISMVAENVKAVVETLGTRP